MLCLLFINPMIKSRQIEEIKPSLAILVDNSGSTKYFKQENAVKLLLQKIKEHKQLDKKFDVTYFSFGKSLKSLDSLSFNEPQTNISQGIQAINELYKDKIGGVVLISDGNQTIGNDYEFTRSKKAIYPLAIGDTNTYKDVRISQLNVNKYSYVKNKFPVETLLFYEGKDPVTTKFSIFKNGKTVFSQNVSFSPSNRSKTIVTNLTSTKEGLKYYTASVRKIPDEKNTKNNVKSFSVEVIDEQTKVLLLSSLLHPDLGALKKAIESNKQRKVTIELVNKFKGNFLDYQLVVLYQPTHSFKRIFDQKLRNFLIITGAQTDWNFINSQELGFRKQFINQSENYSVIYNSGFLPFLQKNIGFEEFPPLKDKFGELKVTGETQVLLHQKIGGVKTNQPLLATFEKGDNKYAVLFGEGIWKWRMANFVKEQSFEGFDMFLGNLTQYVSSTKKRKRLEVNTKRLYTANSTIVISALYLDNNYKFDSRASLQLTITNQETKKQQTIPFSLVMNSYQAAIENIPSGNYSYIVSVVGQKIKSYGRFRVADYKIEEQFTRANTKKLQKLASNTKGELFYKEGIESLLQQLIIDKMYYTVQKSTIKKQNLIDWKWFLFLIVALLAIEWFTRKYHGKI